MSRASSRRGSSLTLGIYSISCLTTRQMKHLEEHDDTPGVNALLAALTHPLKPTIESVRRAVLEADSAITEGTKWKSPSFYCCGWFLTIGCRKPTQLDVVLHCGAKVQADCTVGDSVEDPEKLLSWPSKDRALLAFKSEADFQAKKSAFQRIVRQWAAHQRRNAAKA